MADTCSVDGCDKPVRSGRASLCGMHYHRQYRHGSVYALASRSGISASHGRRYRRVKADGHILADKTDRAYEHRVVLFDTIGFGPHLCHWCDRAIHWRAGGSHDLEADHLNGVGDDNRPENLVPACPSCNTRRGGAARHAALLAAGFWSEHDTITTRKGMPTTAQVA